MLPITPLFSSAKSLHYMRELLADSKMWQGMVLLPEATAAEIVDVIATNPGALNRDTARDKIALGVLIPTGEEDEDGEVECGYIADIYDTALPLPRMLIRYLTDGTYSRESASSFTRNSSFRIIVEYLVPPVYRERTAVGFSNQEIDGQDKMHRILEECAAVIRAATPDRLQVDSFSIGADGLVMPEDSNGLWMRSCELTAFFSGVC